jgi:hypothetical protein
MGADHCRGSIPVRSISNDHTTARYGRLFSNRASARSGFLDDEKLSGKHGRRQRHESKTG